MSCCRRADGDEGEGLEDDDDDDDNDGDPFPIWEGMGAFQAGEMEAPPPWGVIIVDGFCDYLGRRCARLLKEAGYAVVEVSWVCSLPGGVVVMIGTSRFNRPHTVCQKNGPEYLFFYW